MWSPKHPFMFLYLYVFSYFTLGVISYAVGVSFSIDIIPGSRKMFHTAFAALGASNVAHAFNSTHAGSWVCVALFSLVGLFSKNNIFYKFKTKKMAAFIFAVLLLFAAPSVVMICLMGFRLESLFRRSIVSAIFLNLSMFVTLMVSIQFFISLIKLKVEFGGRADV